VRWLWTKVEHAHFDLLMARHGKAIHQEDTLLCGGAVGDGGAVANGDAALTALEEVALFGVALDQFGLDGDVVVHTKVELHFGVLGSEVKRGGADIFFAGATGVKDV